MKAYIELELIGDDLGYLQRSYQKKLRAFGVSCWMPRPVNGSWVAEITGPNPQYKYERYFLPYHKSHDRANSTGSSGVYAEYVLESGRYYEVKDAGDCPQRYFCTVDCDGNIVRVEEQVVKRAIGYIDIVWGDDHV